MLRINLDEKIYFIWIGLDDYLRKYLLIRHLSRSTKFSLINAKYDRIKR